MASIDSLIQWYFDFPPVQTGEKIFWVLLRRDYFPAWSLALTLCVAVCLTLWFCSRESNGSSRWVRGCLRLIIIGLVTIMLLQVRLRGTHRGQPLLSVLIDDSASMQSLDAYSTNEAKRLNAFSNAPSAHSRREHIQTLFTEQNRAWLAKLLVTHRVEFRNLSGDFKLNDESVLKSGVSSLTFNTPQTDLNLAVEGVFSDYRGALPDALLVITDGNSTVGEDGQVSRIAERCQKAQLPMSIIGVGSEQTPTDLTIENIQHPSFGFAGTPAIVNVDLSTGNRSPQMVHVELRDLDNEVIDSDRHQITGEGTVDLKVSELSPGRNEFRVAVSPLPGEANPLNNEATIRIWARETRLKVLYVERQPRWEFHHLKQTLERDTNIDLDVYLIDADREFVQEDESAIPKLPIEFEEMKTYDVVILGDVDLTDLPSLFVAQLPQLIKQSGSGLMLISGTRYNPVSYAGTAAAALLPIEIPTLNDEPSGRMPLKVTIEGSEAKLFSPHGQQELFTDWHTFKLPYSNLAPRPGSLTFLETRSDTEGVQPAVISMRYGSGQVLQHLIDDSWRWRAQGELYEVYWSQAIRFLAKQRMHHDRNQLDLSVPREQFLQGASIRVTLRHQLKTEPPQGEIELTLQRDGNTNITVPLQPTAADPRIFTTLLEDLTPGGYVASVQLENPAPVTSTTAFRVLEVDQERRFSPLNRDDLEKAAKVSGGGFFHLWEVDELVDQLPNTSRGQQLHSEEVPIWNRWEIVILLIICLTADWILRQRAQTSN